jgi:ABC-type Mn2+/Zn2+ transport system permease subunit
MKSTCRHAISNKYLSNHGRIMTWLLDPLQYSFMRQALLASTLTGATCSLLAVYVMAFMGDAIAHTTLPGLVVAYLNRWNLFFGAIIAAIITALGIGLIYMVRLITDSPA